MYTDIDIAIKRRNLLIVIDLSLSINRYRFSKCIYDYVYSLAQNFEGIKRVYKMSSSTHLLIMECCRYLVFYLNNYMELFKTVPLYLIVIFYNYWDLNNSRNPIKKWPRRHLNFCSWFLLKFLISQSFFEDSQHAHSLHFGTHTNLKKKLSLCITLKFANPYIYWAWWCKS